MRVGSLNECFYVPTSGDRLDLYIVFTQIGQQVFTVPEHLVGTAVDGFAPASDVLKFQEVPITDRNETGGHRDLSG